MEHDRPTEEADMKTPIVVTDRARIAAAHSAALGEKAYRECRVYGMGSRKTA